MNDSEEQSRARRATGFADLFSTTPPTNQNDTTPDSPKAQNAKSRAQSSDFLATLETMGFKTGEQAFVGTVVGEKYEILSFLGKGGMSNIFKVRQIQTGEILALKVLHEHLWQEADSVKRFTLEAQAVSRVSHPNIITFQDFGVTEEGQPFLVMDYLEGRTLTEAIQENDGLPLFTVVCVFEQLADGLAAAHRMGVVHRDLKPDNVMFVSNGDDYLLKLVDFGIAKIIAEDGPTNKLTRTGEIFGSPLYMSPEQCLGDKVDRRTDIYSLGAVIYATVTGDPPLYGANVLETMNKQITDMPHPIAVLRPDVAEREKDSWVSLDDLEYIVMKCMQKRPYDRYQTMDELLVDVRHLADGTPVPRLSAEEQKTASELAAQQDQDGLQAARDAARAKAKQADKPYPQFGAPSPVSKSSSIPVVQQALDTVSQVMQQPVSQPVPQVGTAAPNAVVAPAPTSQARTMEPASLAVQHLSAPSLNAPSLNTASLNTASLNSPSLNAPSLNTPAAMSAPMISSATPTPHPTSSLRRATGETEMPLEPAGRGRPDKFMIVAFIMLVLFVGIAIALFAFSQH
jgi:Serine/threonine protein kinase